MNCNCITTTLLYCATPSPIKTISWFETKLNDVCAVGLYVCYHRNRLGYRAPIIWICANLLKSSKPFIIQLINSTYAYLGIIFVGFGIITRNLVVKTDKLYQINVHISMHIWIELGDEIVEWKSKNFITYSTDGYILLLWNSGSKKF